MGNLFTSTTHLLDLETFKFHRIHEPFYASVPYWGWDFACETYASWYNIMERTTTIKLNNLEIQFDGYSLAPLHYDEKWFVKLKFKHEFLGKWMEIELEVSPLFNDPPVGQGMRLIEVNYVMEIDGSLRRHKSTFQRSPFDPHFKCINTLLRMGIGKPTPDMFMFGIKDLPYHVRYKGKILNGKSYALMLGTYAILLGDDMTFDSLVMLSGAENTILGVEHVAYTVNRYVTKVITLFK